MIKVFSAVRVAPALVFCGLISAQVDVAVARDVEVDRLVNRVSSVMSVNAGMQSTNRISTLPAISNPARLADAKPTGSESFRERWRAKLEEIRKRRAERKAALKEARKRDGVRTTKTKSAEKKTVSSGKNGINALIAKYASQHGVPYSLARAVVQVESTFRPNVTGAAGEIGLMQIKLATARGMGYKGSRKGLYDPATNLYWGMKYLARAHQLSGGSTCGTILKYNGGHGAKRMNPVSSRYCGKVKHILKSA